MLQSFSADVWDFSDVADAWEDPQEEGCQDAVDDDGDDAEMRALWRN